MSLAACTPFLYSICSARRKSKSTGLRVMWDWVCLFTGDFSVPAQCAFLLLSCPYSQEETAAAGRLAEVVRGRTCAAQASYILGRAVDVP